MVWIQKYNKLVLRDYPFIWINMVKVERCDRKIYKGGCMFDLPRKEFSTLEDAKIYMEKLLYKSFTKSLPLLELVTTLKDFEAIPYIYVTHSLWCNNIN